MSAVETEAVGSNTSVLTSNANAVKQISIAIENATDKPELGETAIALLKSAGFTNVYLSEHEVDVAPNTEASTQVIAQRGDGEMADMVKQAIKVGEVQVATTGDLASDVTLVLESDFAA
jgi:polyisoprenyl-teichoic acid--peptidoglycan teichoic acid transferase